MPKTLTGSSASFPAQTSPIDGEPRTAASVETPFQNAANRSQFVYDRVTYLDPDRSGVRRFRTVATRAALAAVAAAARADGDVIYVKGSGVYSYDAASLGVAIDPWIVRPNDIASNVSGRWHHELDGMRGIANGLPQLTAAAQLPITSIDQAIVTGPKIIAIRTSGSLASELWTSSGTATDVPSTTTGTVVLAVGDIVHVTLTASINLEPTGPTGYGNVYIVPRKNGVDVTAGLGAQFQHIHNPIGATERGIPNWNPSYSLSQFWTVTDSGTYDFRLTAKVQANQLGTTPPELQINSPFLCVMVTRGLG